MSDNPLDASETLAEVNARRGVKVSYCEVCGQVIAFGRTLCAVHWADYMLAHAQEEP